MLSCCKQSAKNDSHLMPAAVDWKMSVCGHPPMCFAHEDVAITHRAQLVGKCMHAEIDAVRFLKIKKCDRIHS